MLSTDFFRVDVATGGASSRTRASKERSWMPFLIVVNVYTLGAGVLYPDIFWPMVVTTMSEMFAFSLAFIVLVLCFEGLIKAPERPLEALRERLARRGRFIVGGLFMFIFGLSAYSTYKMNIPNVVPFYADPYLAEIDRFVYGRNAWRVMHEVPPQVGLVVDFFYTRVWPGVLLFGMLSGLIFVDGARLHRYAWGMFFVYAVLGTLLATLFASVGPIFYTDFYPNAPQFINLKPAIQANPYISNILGYSGYLLDAYHGNQLAFAAGISAFPSVHVAVATLSAWFLSGFGRRCAMLGWSHAVIIQFGSIYSGWHYAIDGDVSLILVSAFWIALSRYYDLPLMPAASRRVP